MPSNRIVSNEKELIAYRMKYSGRSHREIAEELGMNKKSVDNAFGSNGTWGQAYEIWSRRESEETQKQVRKALDNVLEYTGDVFVKALVRANEDVESKYAILKETREAHTKGRTTITAVRDAEVEYRKAENRAVDLAEKVMDRAGMSIVTRAKLDTGNQLKTLDQIYADLIADGLDPNAIKFKSTAPTKKERALPE